ncbi:MAG: WD40 repeat domain-containing protein [Gemmataceae bacterium]
MMTVIAIGGVVVSLRLDKSIKDVGMALKQAETERDKALEAEQARDKEKAKNAVTWQSLIDDARVTVHSGRVGQRFKTLKLLQKAASIHKTPELFELATRALTKPDFELILEWDGWGADTQDVTIDANGRRFVHLNTKGRFEIGEFTPHGVVIHRAIPSRENYGIRAQWLSPDGRFLTYLQRQLDAPGGDLWEFCVRDLQAAQDPVILQELVVGADHLGLGYHPNSQELAVSYANRTIHRFSLQTGKKLKEWSCPLHPNMPFYYPSGSKIAVPNGDLVQIVDLSSGLVVQKLQLPNTITQVQWSRDGKNLVIASAPLIHTFDLDSGQEITTPIASTTYFHLSDTETILGADGALRTLKTGHQLMKVPGDILSCGYLTSMQKVYLTRAGNKVRLWRFEPSEEIRTLTRNGAPLDEIIATPGTDRSGRFLATFPAFNSNQFTFFDLATGHQVASGKLEVKVEGFPNHTPPNQGWSLVNPTGFYDWPISWPSTSGDPVKIGPIKQVLSFQAPMALGTGCSLDGSVIAVPNIDHTLIYHRNNPSNPLKTAPQKRFVQNAGVSPDGTLVASAVHADQGKGPSVVIWDAKTGNHIKDLTSEPNGGLTVRFSRDGSWLALHFSDRWDIYNAKTWTIVHKTRGGEFLTFSHDGKMYAIDMPELNGMIQLIETATGRVIADLPASQQAKYRPLHFTPDGTKLITQNSSQTALFVWDLRKIRESLSALQLDWEWPAFLPDRTPQEVVRLETDLMTRDLNKRTVPTLVDSFAKFKQNLSKFTSPSTTQQYLNRGMIFSRTRSYDQALRDFNLAIQHNPKYLGAVAARGNEYFRRGEWAAAIADYDVDRTLDPNYFPSRFRRANALVELGMHTEALIAFTELIDLPDLDATYKQALYVLRADVRRRLGDTAGVAGDLAQSVRPIPKTSPQSTSTPALSFNDFSWALVSTPPENRVPKAALLVMRQCIALEPNEPNYLNTLGVAEYRNGLYREAIVTLQKSLKLGKGQSDAFDLYFLAMAHAQLKDAAAAKDCFDRAVVWTQAQAKLSNNHKMELRMFHDEAAQLFKRKN